MTNVKILHLAPENTAGVPYNLMKMQRQFGIYSRLITFYNVPYDYPEDVCLNLTLSRSPLAMKWRNYKKKRLHSKLYGDELWTHLPYYKPGNLAERVYLKYREFKNSRRFEESLKKLEADSFDVIHFDGGIDFYSDSRTAKLFKSRGKKIVNCYFGDDLRTRGIVKEMDELSDLNLTFEYDHTLRHPSINFLFFPFDLSEIPYITDEKYYSSEQIRIIHSPTDRFVKGTYEIINAVESAKKYHNFEFILAENMPRKKLLELKQTCHIAIDQIGNRGGTGYGINSLESLSMGIPTVTDMNCGMDKWLPENPFIIANKDNLSEILVSLLSDKTMLKKYRDMSRQWVNKYHSYDAVFRKLKEYYLSAGINL